jgi:hypothetical protein
MKHLKITTLHKGWTDRDEVLLHAAFQILVDFMEGERPGEIIDWNFDEGHKHVWKEIKSLYKWWTNIRPARRSPLDVKKIDVPPLKSVKIAGTDTFRIVQPDRKKYSKYFSALKKHSLLEKKWYEEDQRNLHRLIEIRSHLWT